MTMEVYQIIPDPSYAQGYASNAAEAKNPHLWDGLVGGWMPSLGPTSDIIVDISGNKNNHQLSAAMDNTNWAASIKGYELQFNTETPAEYAEVNKSLIPNHIYSVVAFVKAVNYDKTQIGISSAGITGSPLKFMFLGLDTGGTALFGLRNDAVFPYAYSTNNWTIGEWYSLAGISYSSSYREVYMNALGMGTNSTTYTGAPSWDKVWLGALGVGNPTPLGRPSTVHSAFVYNRVLSYQEIKQLSDDPMALVRKKETVYPFIQGEVSEFQPSWALGSNNLLGVA